MCFPISLLQNITTPFCHIIILSGFPGEDFIYLFFEVRRINCVTYVVLHYFGLYDVIILNK